LKAVTPRVDLQKEVVGRACVNANERERERERERLSL
jgi:hypothetical protein